MTLFFEKVICKKIISIVNQKISNCTIFKKISWGSMPTNPLPHTKGMASLSCGYVQSIALAHANLHVRRKILTPYQILYTLLAYMYKLIKDIKYIFKNSHTITILMLYIG